MAAGGAGGRESVVYSQPPLTLLLPLDLNIPGCLLILGEVNAGHTKSTNVPSKIEISDKTNAFVENLYEKKKIDVYDNETQYLYFYRFSGVRKYFIYLFIYVFIHP